MNEFFNTLQKEARATKLSQNEKQAMRVHLYKIMEEQPAYSAAQQEVLGEVAARRAVPSMYHWFSPRFSVPMALLLVVGLSAGTAFAAQSALPGEPLYAVKIQVNEKVAVALATTPQAKAQVNARLATTRLEEAETLASQGTLNATTTAELASNFAQHAEAAHVGVVAIASQDPGAAAQLDTTFSSTLAAHGAILAQLATDAGSSSVQISSDALAVQVLAQAAEGREGGVREHGVPTSTALAIAPTGENKESTDTLAPTVHVGATSLRVERRAMLAPQAFGVEATNNTSTTTAGAVSGGEGDAAHADTTVPAPSSKKMAPAAAMYIDTNDGTIALALGSQASTTLSAAEADFAALAPSLDASTTAQIQAQINTLESLLAQGNNALMADDNTPAKEAFGHVLRASVRLDAFLKAGQKFNVSFLNSLLND